MPATTCVPADLMRVSAMLESFVFALSSVIAWAAAAWIDGEATSCSVKPPTTGGLSAALAAASALGGSVFAAEGEGTGGVESADVVPGLPGGADAPSSVAAAWPGGVGAVLPPHAGAIATTITTTIERSESMGSSILSPP